MDKHKKNIRINRLALFLFASSIIVEVFNIFFSMQANIAQQSICPRSQFPGYASTAILIVSAIIAMLAAMQIKKERRYAILLALFYIAIIASIQPLLWFTANGGMDWCNFHF